MAEVEQAEVDRILQRFAMANPATEGGTDAVVERREDLLSRSGLLLPRAGQRAGFQHLSFQEFLAAEHLARTLEENEALHEAKRRRDDVRAGRVQRVPGDEARRKVRDAVGR